LLFLSRCKEIDDLQLLCIGGIPPSWGEDAAFPALLSLQLISNALNGTLPPSFPPALQQLDLYGNQLQGNLPTNWPPGLQLLFLPGNALTGTLPVELGSLTQLQQRTLAGNNFHAGLPPEWGAPAAFPELLVMGGGNMNVTGTLPAEWGGPSAFQSLVYLTLDNNDLTGDLPDSWASDGAFPFLVVLEMDHNSLNGTIPASWGSVHAFPNLQMTYLDNNLLQGSVPAFNNAKLGAVLLDNCSSTSGLDAFWTSTAPLLMAALQNNSISGHLWDSPSALDQLALLDLRGNTLLGTVPLSWLREGNMLSHVSYLDVAGAWQRSIDQNNWRQQLCLNKDLYNADVTGQQLAVLPTLQQRLLHEANAVNFDAKQWLQSGTDQAIAELQAALDPASNVCINNQLISVTDICANHNADRVLLIVRLVFGGCCLFVTSVYLAARWHTNRHGSTRFGLLSSLVSAPVWAVMHGVYDTCQGLGGLAFYYYDLVTNIILLAQVSGTWPAALLLSILLFHFAVVGVVVAFHAIYKLFGLKYDMSGIRLPFGVALVMLSLVVGPCLIPGILLLDTCAFVRRVLLCIKQVARLPGFQWTRPAYSIAFRFNDYLHNMRYFGLGWVDLESYESMHNLIAAILQSLPTVVLNSVIFSLGNKPSHGIFLSDGLFITAVIASCLAMLKSLTAIQWQAFRQTVHPVRHAASLVIGRTLAGKHVETNTIRPRQNSTVQLLAQQYQDLGSAPLGSPEQASRQAEHFSAMPRSDIEH